MRPGIYVLAVIGAGLVLAAAAPAQEISGLMKEEIAAHGSLSEDHPTGSSPPTRVYLRRAIGELDITSNSSTETYEAYFHVPIPFQEQVPILIEVESPYLIDYRFVHLNSPNVIVAARMNRGSGTQITWTAWVLVKENTYDDLPTFVPIPTPEELPDSVKKWLVPTDCAQLDAPIVQEIAEEILGTTTNLMVLADDICDYCYDIPWQFPHSPSAFDAVYTLTWGNSCTGHAHAGAALFRANGIPARSLLNIPTWYSGYLDMHWIIDYFVPDYGWVRMETSTGQHPTFAEQEIVVFACNPEDEYPLYFPCGIEGIWHTSDPVMGMMNPYWGGAHRAFNVNYINEETGIIEQAHALTDSVFCYYSRYWGINMTPGQQACFQNALAYQTMALTNLQGMDLNSYIANMQLALNSYRDVNPALLATTFLDDFEGGLNGWTHGGTQDEWELGEPLCGPQEAHSGTSCWGTDLDDTYENSSSCWLLSPEIDLTEHACAYLHFWVWNWVEDVTQGYVFDPLWLDITTDGTTFCPLSSWMGGVNDDPEIPDVGGWSMVGLDLTKYVGNTVNIRFRFASDGSVVQPGAYIDDFHVYGRIMDLSAIEDSARPAEVCRLHQNHPNPFSLETTIRFTLDKISTVMLEICDIQGKRVRTLVDRNLPAGDHLVEWDGKDDRGDPVTSGIYFYKIEAGHRSGARRLILLK